jgi:hypothetical protein
MLVAVPSGPVGPSRRLKLRDGRPMPRPRTPPLQPGAPRRRARADPPVPEHRRDLLCRRPDQPGEPGSDLIETRQGRQGLDLAGVDGAPLDPSPPKLEGLVLLGVAHQGPGEAHRIAVGDRQRRRSDEVLDDRLDVRSFCRPPDQAVLVDAVLVAAVSLGAQAPAQLVHGLDVEPGEIRHEDALGAAELVAKLCNCLLLLCDRQHGPIPSSGGLLYRRGIDPDPWTHGGEMAIFLR